MTESKGTKNEKKVKLPIRLSNSNKVASDRLHKISWTGTKIIWTEITTFVARCMAMGLLVIDENLFWQRYEEITPIEFFTRAGKEKITEEPDGTKKDQTNPGPTKPD